jgi:thiamine pyrophosphate-dependent acetolactate synthase large subunit-like protein/nitrite reductase/ring-hydroxylating ferredoxin subunit
MNEPPSALPVPADKEQVGVEWHRVEPGGLAVGEVARVVVGDRALCITRTEAGYGALDNRCPHQGGPLGEGQIEDGWVVCPWHAFEYDPLSGAPPEGYGDYATVYPVEERDEGLFVELPTFRYRPTLMDQMVDVMTDWGVDTVFGMVGHSNLGMADALRRGEEKGSLQYFGIRHEGAGAFAASAYAKLTGRPAACFSIAGPGATNLLTGLWDAKVDRVPILALTGQVQSQVIGPGAFQEIPTAEAFSAVAEWSQTVVSSENASELMALAVKHAVVKRDVAHLVLPDEVQERTGLEDPPGRPREGRVSTTEIAPPERDLQRAVELLEGAERPVLIVGNGARPHRGEIVAFAERFELPVVTTFKAKGVIADDHPLGCGVLGRSGTPVGSSMMGKSDGLLVLGASFSNHTGISKRKPTIQVDFDRMMLGKFHSVDVALWGEIGRTLEMIDDRMSLRGQPEVRAEIAARKDRWRAEKVRRSAMRDRRGAMHPALLFGALGKLAPEDAVLPVDVGNNTYAFGHYFECKAAQDVLMSGYLGSIGFALPAALGAWAATRGSRPIISIGGDGGLGQYLAEFTTAVKYEMGITHVVLNNDELAKISREQVGALRPVWQTSLVNPDFAEFARLCGGEGVRVDEPEDLEAAFEQALAVEDRPSLVEVRTSPRWV